MANNFTYTEASPAVIKSGLSEYKTEYRWNRYNDSVDQDTLLYYTRYNTIHWVTLAFDLPFRWAFRWAKP